MSYDPDLQPIIDELRAGMAANKAAIEKLAADRVADTAAVNAALKALDDRVDVLEATETPTPPPTPLPQFPGDVTKGTIRWGAGIGGNADPVARHESVAGVSMGIRRTFWDMSKTASLISTAKADITAKRLPWVSVKLGMTWADVAAGKLDSQLTTLFKSLAVLPGPVWFTAHHEPEGGNGTPYPDDGQGTEGNWRAMQAQVRKVLNASGAKNIAFAPILMSWTFDTRSGRNPADWWVDGIWDFVGIDHYCDSETATGPANMASWANTMAFYKAKNIRIAIGEWGNRGIDAVAANEMQAFYNQLISIHSPGVCYFDSGLNATNGSWELLGEPLKKFRELMKVPTSVRLP